MVVANDLLDEKEAEKRATMYRPKIPLKRELKLQFCRVSAFFYASLLGVGLYLSYLIIHYYQDQFFYFMNIS